MSEALDKLSELREATKEPTQDDERFFASLEREIKQRDNYTDWLNHPVSKEITSQLVTWLVNNEKTWPVTEAVKLRSDFIIEFLNLISPRKAWDDQYKKNKMQQMDDSIKEIAAWNKNHGI